MEVNNIDDIINLVESGSLNDKMYCKVVNLTLGVICLLPEPIAKDTKLKFLNEWKEKHLKSEQTPLFFVEDPFANRERQKSVL